MKKFDELVAIFEKLRSPRGCKWDRIQTHESLIKYLKEETKEFVDAVKTGNSNHMKDELGDILLQVMFHSQIAKDEGKFTIEDVIDNLIKKLKRRHPHVFASPKGRGRFASRKKVRTVKDIIANWEKIKKLEKLKR